MLAFDGNLIVDPYIRHQWLRDFRRLSIAPVSGQAWEDFQLIKSSGACVVAARFADPIVSVQPYQFAIDMRPWERSPLAVYARLGIIWK